MTSEKTYSYSLSDTNKETTKTQSYSIEFHSIPGLVNFVATKLQFDVKNTMATAIQKIVYDSLAHVKGLTLNQNDVQFFGELMRTIVHQNPYDRDMKSLYIAIISAIRKYALNEFITYNLDNNISGARRRLYLLQDKQGPLDAQISIWEQKMKCQKDITEIDRFADLLHCANLNAQDISIRIRKNKKLLLDNNAIAKSAYEYIEQTYNECIK